MNHSLLTSFGCIPTFLPIYLVFQSFQYQTSSIWTDLYPNIKWALEAVLMTSVVPMTYRFSYGGSARILFYSGKFCKVRLVIHFFGPTATFVPVYISNSHRLILVVLGDEWNSLQWALLLLFRRIARYHAALSIKLSFVSVSLIPVRRDERLVPTWTFFRLRTHFVALFAFFYLFVFFGFYTLFRGFAFPNSPSSANRSLLACIF